MAIITPSALISNIKGKIGGTVFQGSTQGISMRNKPTKLGVGSQSQQRIRQINAQLNYSWSTMTNDQRNVWSAFNTFVNGVGKSANQKITANSGRMQFMSVNFFCLLYGKSIIIAPTFTTPESINVPCPPLFTSSDTLMDYTVNLDTTTQILVTRVSLPQSNPTKTTNTGYRTLVYDQIDGLSQDWSDAYQKTFGINLIPGKYYWVSLQVVNFITGTVSPVAQQLVLLNASGGIGSMIIGSTFIVS